MNFSFLNWDKYPFLRYVVLLIFGIWGASVFDVPLNHFYTGALIVLIAILVWIAPMRGYVLLGLMLLSGFFIGNYHQQRLTNIPTHQSFIGKLEEVIGFKKTGAQVLLNVTKLIYKNNKPIPVKLLVLTYVPQRAGDLKSISVGDEIRVEGIIKFIAKPENPGGFDAQKYWKNQGVMLHSFASHVAWLQKGSVYEYKSIAYRTRQYCDGIFRAFITDSSAYAIVTAMVVGLRTQLNPYLKEAYANAGIIHVIAISGLHIALFFVLINGVLSRFIQSKLLLAIIVLLIIWFYCFVAGMTASVVRAALMYSIVIVGQAFHRKTNLLNNLCCSAFVLLLINPNYLFDIGFQLSYLAITGIVVIDLFWNNTLALPSLVLNYVWALLRVSFVAQMATFPLLLLYFHKISLSFLIANLLVIPISTVIIWLSLALLIFSFLPCGMTVFVGVMLTKLTCLMNYIALSIGNYTYGSLNDVSFSVFECLAVYLLIISILVYLKFGKHLYLYLVILTMLMFGCLRTFVQWKYNTQFVVVAYALKNNSLLMVVSGQHCKMFLGKSIDDFTKKNCRDFLNKHGVDEIETSLSSKNAAIDSLGYQLIRLNKEKLLIIKSDKIPLFDQKIEYLQLINNPVIDWQLLVQHYHQSKVIIDKSNSSAYAYRLEKYLSSRNILVHNMYTKGAFVLGESF